MGAFLDDLKDTVTSVKETARDVSEIRSDWQATQQIYYGDSGNVPVQQAQVAANTAQRQGNVLSASQWNADGIAKAISGGANNTPLLIAAGVLVAALLLVKR